MEVDTWIIPPKSDMMFDMENIDVSFSTELETTSDGFLKPKFWEVSLNWGQSSFYHENFLLAMLFDNLIKQSLIIVQNAVYYFGDVILNSMLEPVMTKIFYYYQIPIHLAPLFDG